MELNSYNGRDEAVLKIVFDKGKEKSALDHIMDHLQKNLYFKIKTRTFTTDELANLQNSKLKNFIDNRNN
jgi:hypothetical protein